MIENQLRKALQQTCKALNKYDVKFIIIGGVAVGFHGYQRISGGYNPNYPEFVHDIDFWYEPTISNFHKLIQALDEMQIDTSTLNSIVFDPKKTYLRIPHHNFKTEFLPQISGLESFSKSYETAKKIELDGNTLFIISYKDLIKNKEEVNRDIDRRDIKELKNVRRRED